MSLETPAGWRAMTPIQFAICNEIFQGWSLEDTFAYAAGAGYDAVEIAPFTIANDVTKILPDERRRIREMAARTGIRISGIHWVLVQTEGIYLTHPDPEVRGRTTRYFNALVDFCADIGGKHIVVGSPKQRNLMEGVTHSQAWEWATAVFREPVRIAAERDVTICFEPLAPSETNFINTAEEAVRFTRQLESPHFKIILDVKAMSSEAKPVPQIIRESWPHFAYFHANDVNLKGPGFGEVDFKTIAAALCEVGYNGFVSVEVFKFEEGPEAIATRSIEYLKRVFG
jgi:sugar phosphate isomerase/epimerase